MQTYFELLLLSTLKVLSYFSACCRLTFVCKQNFAYKQVLVLTCLTYMLANLFIYLLLLLGTNSKIGKILNSLQTQTYFSQIYPSWYLQRIIS